MKKIRKTPYIFMTLLIAILLFILGTRYGQKVEKSNEAISYMLSITPTKTSTPKPEPSIEYNLFVHKECGISFLKPSYLTVKEESSTGAKLLSQQGENIEFNCKNNIIVTPKIDQKVATDSIRINEKEIIAMKKEQQINNRKVQLLEFSVPNTSKKSRIEVKIHANLKAIFEQTFKLLP